MTNTTVSSLVNSFEVVALAMSGSIPIQPVVGSMLEDEEIVNLAIEMRIVAARSAPWTFAESEKWQRNPLASHVKVLYQALYSTAYSEMQLERRVSQLEGQVAALDSGYIQQHSGQHQRIQQLEAQMEVLEEAFAKASLERGAFQADWRNALEHAQRVLDQHARTQTACAHAASELSASLRDALQYPDRILSDYYAQLDLRSMRASASGGTAGEGEPQAVGTDSNQIPAHDSWASSSS